MELSAEQVTWLVKAVQPVASFPGLTPDLYATAHARLVAGAKDAARELLADPAVCAMVDRLPVKKGGKVVAFGDSHTSDPQSWAVILSELLASRRPDDGISVVINAASGETTTHGLIRIGQVIALEPDWILFFIGVNDAKTHGPNASKTIVDHRETARNVEELQRRASRETKARCLWITPPPVIAERVERHWALARFGVHFSNEDVARVANAIAKLEAPHIDLFSALAQTPELVTEDGVHFRQEGHKRMALEIVRAWSTLR